MSSINPQTYRHWIKHHERRRDGEPQISLNEGPAEDSPHFTIIEVSGKRGGRPSRRLARSIRAQSYFRWTFHHILWPWTPQSIAEKVMESGSQYIILLPNDAVLAPNALFKFASAIAENGSPDLIFADQDRLGYLNRFEPQFKTAFDMTFLLGRDHVGIPAAYRKSTLLALCGDVGRHTSLDLLFYDLALSLALRFGSASTCHVPAILAHRKGNGDWSGDEARALLSRKFGPLGYTFEPCPENRAWTRASFSLSAPLPLVSIIIPTKDRVELLRASTKGVLQQTDYPNIELIIVDNHSTDPDSISYIENLATDRRVKVIRDEGDFNYSRLNNSAVQAAQGAALILLNNDIEVTDRNWLLKMIGHLYRSNVGIVGARLLYPDRRVQHAGVVYGPGMRVDHQLRFSPGMGDQTLPDVALTHSLSAVTGACLAIRKDLYLEVGGLDEENFAVAFNDIDLCARVKKRGFDILYAADVVLIHHESASRRHLPSSEASAREHEEHRRFCLKHSDLFENRDPFRNPQLAHHFEGTQLATTEEINLVGKS